MPGYPLPAVGKGTQTFVLEHADLLRPVAERGQVQARVQQLPVVQVADLVRFRHKVVQQNLCVSVGRYSIESL